MRRFTTLVSGLFACVTGCGDDGVHHLADAPVAPDAGIDAIATGTANVTAKIRCCAAPAGGPQEGVRVVVVHRDHTVGATAVTDASGKASVAVQTGDAVTAVYPEDTVSNTTKIATFVGVKPGDNLTFGDAFDYAAPMLGTPGQLNVSWPAMAGAGYYYVFTPCGQFYGDGASLGATVNLYDYCQTPTAPMVFVAYDSAGVILASSYLPDAPFAPGTLPAITWTPITAPNYALSVSGLDAAISQLSFTAMVQYPSQLLVGAQANPLITAGSATANLTAPASGLRNYETMDLRRSGTQGRQHYAKSNAATAAFTAPLPWINGIAVSPGDGQAVWLQTAGAYDAATLHFNWNRYDGKVTHFSEWSVILPPGLTALDLGTPPAELAPYLPTAVDNLGTSLVLVDLAAAANYDAIRALPEWRVMTPDTAIHAGEEAAMGMSVFDGGEGFAAAARH